MGGYKYLENKLLLISVNFTPKTSHSCLKNGTLCFPGMNISVFFFSSFIYLTFLRFVGFGLDRKPTNKDDDFPFHFGYFVCFFLRYQDPQRVIVLLMKVGEISTSLGVFFSEIHRKGRIWCMDFRGPFFFKALLYFVGELYV